MQSNKFIKTAKKIAEKDKATFDSLIEFENTKKIRTKIRLNFTIDNAIASRFKKYCRENGFNMSRKVEHMMKALIEKQ